MKEDIKVRNSAEKNVIGTQRERNKQISQQECSGILEGNTENLPLAVSLAYFGINDSRRWGLLFLAL